MSNLIKLWAGRVYGTNTGNISIKLEKADSTISGVLRFMDSIFGLVVYDITGTFDGELKIKGVPTQHADGIAVGELTVEAKLTPTGNLYGAWETTLGTGGAFEAFPHDIDSVGTNLSVRTAVPEQLHTKSTRIGSLRLFTQDIQQLFP